MATKKKPATRRRVPAPEAARQPTLKERLGWQIESMARELTLADPRVKRIEERHKTRLEKMVPVKGKKE